MLQGIRVTCHFQLTYGLRLKWLNCCVSSADGPQLCIHKYSQAQRKALSFLVSILFRQLYLLAKLWPKPNYLGCEPAHRLLLSTCTITIYYYFYCLLFTIITNRLEKQYSFYVRHGGCKAELT